MDRAKVSVGIDVAKEWLDVAERPAGEAWRVRNDEPGIAALVERLAQRAPAVVVLEATGGIESALVAALAAAQTARGGREPTASARLRQGHRPAR